MSDPSLIVLITAEPTFAREVRVRLRSVPNVVIRVFETVQEVDEQTSATAPGLVLVDWDERRTLEDLAYLLSRQARPGTPVPLIVISPEYDEMLGLTLFRMGVADYLSRADHLDQLASVVNVVVQRAPRRVPEPARGSGTGTCHEDTAHLSSIS